MTVIEWFLRSMSLPAGGTACFGLAFAQGEKR